MANNTVRLPMRNRTGPQRTKVNGDENATGRHVRQPSSVAVTGATRASHSLVNVQALKNGPQRAALGEVTTAAVNRKQDTSKIAGTGKEKETIETGLKRSRSSSLAAATGPQRVPLGPGRISTASNAQVSAPVRAPLARVQRPSVAVRATHRVPVPREPVITVPVSSQQEDDGESDDMEVEDHVEPSRGAVAVEKRHSIVVAHHEPEAMVGMDSENEQDVDDDDEEPVARPARIWPELGTARAMRFRQEVDEIRETFEDYADDYDPNMVSEYSEEIFEYMLELEEDCMPSPDYMSAQSEITWSMRQTLIDWLLQVHLRYHMQPETLFTAVNIVDRFLTKRVVSLVKLQLVGVTAIFIAAKYEEIVAPSVDEFVYMTERGYTREEILKGERIVLQTLDFKISNYCCPYSWIRKISKADNYDIQTRTLSKFLVEVTLLDHRFLRVKPSMIAAIGMFTARRMLGGYWTDSFIFHSGYTEEHLLPGHALLVQKLSEGNFPRQHVCKKYAHKRFLKASGYAVEWARLHYEEEGNMEGMILEE